MGYYKSKRCIAGEERFEQFIGMKDSKEWFTGWMYQWLKYLEWSCMRAIDTVVTIEELFDAPQVMTSWRLNRKDHNLVRFGFYGGLMT